MKYKIGDRVKFLNENGGGVVSKIISPKMVNVAIDDGFEIPVLTADLLKIELDAPANSPKHMFDEDFHVDYKPEEPGIQYESDERNVPLLAVSAKGKVEPGVYLAFVPQDQKWLITGLIDVYLVNHTDYELLYNVYLKKDDGNLSGFDYGSVAAASMVLLASIEREKIESWCKGLVQVMFHAEEKLPVLSPGNTEFKVKAPRFYKETSYRESSIIDGKAVLISLLALSSVIPLQGNEDKKEEIPAENQVQKAREVKPEVLIDKHRTSPHEAVVDLHIGELLDDYSKMENYEILRIQINYFTNCLESAIANDISKVTFIHGVGTGVLKTAMKEILKDYDRVEYREASMKEFGYGAMDVILH